MYFTNPERIYFIEKRYCLLYRFSWGTDVLDGPIEYADKIKANNNSYIVGTDVPDGPLQNDNKFLIFIR